MLLHVLLADEHKYRHGVNGTKGDHGNITWSFLNIQSRQPQYLSDLGLIPAEVCDIDSI